MAAETREFNNVRDKRPWHTGSRVQDAFDQLFRSAGDFALLEPTGIA